MKLSLSDHGSALHKRPAGVAFIPLCIIFFLLAFILSASSDTITLKNGGTITCKVIKEMHDLVKVRMPHKGTVVTTFLSRGAIQSITKSSDVENRKLFQGGGVQNPGRAFEPVYYSGSAPGPKAAKGPGGARPGARGKPAGKIARKGGVEDRRKRSDDRSKARENSTRGGTSSSSQAAGSAGTSASAPTTASSSPSTSAGTSISTFGK